MIRIENVCKAYGNGEEKLEVLKDISLTVEAGEFITIIGPSGSGKSTLLHTVGGLEEISSGQIFLDNEPIHQLKDSQLAKIRLEKVGFIFQQFQLLSSATALENVMMPLLNFFGKRDTRKKAEEALTRVGLSHRMNHLPSKLSGGEQQRVAIARALVTNPKLILADEPTGNLDSTNGENIISLLERIHQEDGVTIVLITHDKEIAYRADRVIHFLDGRIVREEVLKVR
ncbi:MULTISPECIES: ABC transporter ATP-binding protein [Sutcliffiella]|uniref:ABC transporter ATP-binding protein n=1 Tax=Sutcliffiella cohnii TaxID=33932 RepID=A0A223KNZ8_9BACI|nr:MULTISPECIES: ABC transporter ATP-binding protein [Sutcliffiella]AST91126.1 ABC transporter ATP-binding protein [Sutcliffiella cohnii]WBL16926.1 ABC transporter ATP-binding protein [Sutcliffiella sp. NC1]